MYNEKILVVDDSPTVLKVLEKILNDIGFTSVTSFSKADEAYDALLGLSRQPEKAFELVISDWHMKEMTGLQLLTKMKADEVLAKIPFLMITADENTMNMVSAMQSGVNGYIIKPFNAQQVKDKVLNILEKRFQEDVKGIFNKPNPKPVQS